MLDFNLILPNLLTQADPDDRALLPLGLVLALCVCNQEGLMALGEWRALSLQWSQGYSSLSLSAIKKP